MPNKETPQRSSARNTPKSDAPPRFSEDTHKKFQASELPADEGAEIRETEGRVTPRREREVGSSHVRESDSSNSKYAANTETLRESEVNQPKSGHKGGRTGKTQTH
ncbi:hypothetical protein ACLVWU_09975 [Bdellovibrio sp. HCB290]|uniref:hypothetical protein n=1 Tax=Bdellovibrio sp. HCB290 TaxID=3394356 RepID=UPI0039B48BF5